jgi:D-tyrosyl-tRNA(Tyr) deacylase
MKVVIQRVTQATLSISQKEYAAIRQGMLVLLGIEEADTNDDIEWLAKKITNLRIFNDAAGVMNKSLIDIKGELLLVSQFTLHANTKKGNRPSYIRAAKPETAIPLYEKMIEQLNQLLKEPVKTGKFGADMQINLTNDGPVTIIIDTKNKE